MTRPPTPSTATALRGLVAAALVAALAACGPVAPSGPPSTVPSISPPPAASASAEPSAPSAEPSAAATASAATTADCARADVRATSDGWGGAAGSRGSDVTVENVGAAPCLLPPIPVVAIFDDNGRVVLQNPPRVGSEPPPIEPGDTATFSFQMSNWCDESAALPFHVSVVMADDAVGIEGLQIETLNDLPQCLGPGQPATLSTTDWELN